MNVAEVAKQFIGVKELGDNAGFDSPYFQVLLTKLGWHAGSAWCAYFAMLVWYLYYQGKDVIYARLKHVLHPHVLTMWERACSSQVLTVGQVPMVGAIACWKTRKKGAGHCGIVVEVHADGTFTCVEGNTSVKLTGNQREGDGVYEKKRHTRSTGDWGFLGFIYLYQQ